MADRELHIRINKRTFERAVYFIVIIALIALLVWKWNAVAPIQADVNVDELTADNVALQAEVSTLETRVADLEEELLLYDEAGQERTDAIEGATDPETTTPTPEPEETGLSGYVDITWDITMNGDELEDVEITIINGVDSTEEADYKLYWETFFEDTVFIRDTVVVRSGQEYTEIIVEGGQGIASNPPDTVDTLVLEVRDGSGDLIDQLEEVVR